MESKASALGTNTTVISKTANDKKNHFKANDEKNRLKLWTPKKIQLLIRILGIFFRH